MISQQAFNPGLVLSFDILSIRLSDFDYQEDALLAIQEAVRLQRHLAADRPATFNPGLASSLDIRRVCGW